MPMPSWCSTGALAAASVVLALSAGTAPAFADEAARTATAKNLAAGTLAAGATELEAMLVADPKNDEARMGLGLTRFVQALEKLSQGLYRYGLESPKSFLIPVLRLPVPPNPNPEAITYADFRGLIQTFVTDLDTADKTLTGVESLDAKLPLDLATIRYDANGDGKADPEESLLAVMNRITGMQPDQMPASLAFGFDKGDALWLRGYSNVLGGFGEFILAHDWHESFDDSFFHFFPAMKSPFRDALAPPSPDMYSEAAPIADFISFMHIRWPVSEPDRMKASLAHFKTMVALSRESWAAIMAETDDDHEWLPSPKQGSPFASIVVTPESVAAWHVVLDEVDLILDGKKLVPHWRFTKGFNLNKAFTDPQPFDIVLWITGPAVLPYLEDGPVATSEEWDHMTEAFGGNFGLFAIWAN